MQEESVCWHIMAFQRIHGWGQKVAEGGLVGEEAEEAAGLKLAAGLAMAESFGSCSGACNRSPNCLIGISPIITCLTSGSTSKHK